MLGLLVQLVVDSTCCCAALCPAVQVSRAVRDSLTVRAADFGIVLEDIAITHLSFGTEFTKVRALLGTRHACLHGLSGTAIDSAATARGGACHLAMCCLVSVKLSLCVGGDTLLTAALSLSLCFFMPGYCLLQAVEMKQVAEQDAERARFVVLKAEQVGLGDTGLPMLLQLLQQSLPREPSIVHASLKLAVKEWQWTHQCRLVCQAVAQVYRACLQPMLWPCGRQQDTSIGYLICLLHQGYHYMHACLWHYGHT